MNDIWSLTASYTGVNKKYKIKQDVFVKHYEYNQRQRVKVKVEKWT